MCVCFCLLVAVCAFLCVFLAVCVCACVCLCVLFVFCFVGFGGWLLAGCAVLVCCILSGLVLSTSLIELQL